MVLGRVAKASQAREAQRVLGTENFHASRWATTYWWLVSGKRNITSNSRKSKPDRDASPIDGS